MNEIQRTILAIAAVALILAVLFFVPWRVAYSEEIKWAPLYRPPVSYSQSYDTSRPGARYSYDEAEIALGIYLLEILAVGLVGGAAYVLSAGERKEELD